MKFGDRLLPDYETALGTVLAAVPIQGTELVDLQEAHGRVLREGVAADRDQPPFDRAAMDGFAVRSSDVRASARLPVVGTISAGDPPSPEGLLREGASVRIATGAPVPAGADAVVPIENAQLEDAESDHGVAIMLEAASPWLNVHRCGSDAQAGTVVLRAGTVLKPQHVGIAASVGKTRLRVSSRPRIQLITTGDEVTAPQIETSQLEPQQIRNSNGPMLKAFIAALGAGDPVHFHVRDSAEATLEAADKALNEGDLVITVGGVSAGHRDWLPWAWSKLGLSTIVHGVQIQPGKPLLVARPKSDVGKLVIGLPGNPVSVLATAHLFLWPVFACAMAADPPPWRKVTLAEPVKANPKRQMFRVARLGSDGAAMAVPWHGSGDLIHTSGFDGWLRLPIQAGPVPAGSLLPFLPAVG